MSDIAALQAAEEGNQSQTCPYLGMQGDPQTSLSYPSSWNVCHHTRPTATPRLEFQESFCFRVEHTSCPVFIRSVRASMPSGIRFPFRRPSLIQRVILPALAGTIVVLLVVLGVLRLVQERNNQNGGQAGMPGTATPTASLADLPTGTLLLTDTPVPPTPSLTPSPTSTSTPATTVPATRPTDTSWSTLPPTRTQTFVPTWTPRPTETLWPSHTPTNTP